MVEYGDDYYDEYWESMVNAANGDDGYQHSRMLYNTLIRFLRTGEPGALCSPAVRSFLADGLEDALQVKNPGEAGRVMKINSPKRRKGTGDHQHTERTFVNWYCEQCEVQAPTNAEMRSWKMKHADVVSDRTFGSWKSKARHEFNNPKSLYHMFKEVAHLE